MRHRYALIVLALAALGTGACGPGDRRPFADTVDRSVPDLLARDQVPGAAVALVENGALGWTGSYGTADREAGKRVTASTVFQVASLSKSLTAWGALHLVERGQLDLDAPVERYLTRWHLPPSAFDAGRVTTRRLLSHTAGLSVHGYGGYAPEAILPTLERSLAGDTGYAVFIEKPPGSTFQYSGGGFNVLQLLIEEIAREPFAAFMKREVLQPLGMAQSSFEWETALRSSTAGAYDEKGRRLPNFLFTEQAAAGLYTTVGDLGRFVAAGLNGSAAPGRGVLKPASASLLQAPAALTAGGYGLGCEIYPLPTGEPSFGHGGVNRGWRALWVAVPGQGAGIAVMANSENADQLVREVVCHWYAEVATTSPSFCP